MNGYFRFLQNILHEELTSQDGSSDDIIPLTQNIKRISGWFFLVAPFLENGATYLLSIVSVGMFVCMCVCFWTVRI